MGHSCLTPSAHSREDGGAGEGDRAGPDRGWEGDGRDGRLDGGGGEGDVVVDSPAGGGAVALATCVEEQPVATSAEVAGGVDGIGAGVGLEDHVVVGQQG